jgi:hypothetical protein
MMSAVVPPGFPAAEDGILHRLMNEPPEPLERLA